MQKALADFSFGITREMCGFPSAYGSHNIGLSSWGGRAWVHTANSLPMCKLLPAGLFVLHKNYWLTNAAHTWESPIPSGFRWGARVERQVGFFSLKPSHPALSLQTSKSLVGICRETKRNSADTKPLFYIEPPKKVMFKEKPFCH